VAKLFYFPTMLISEIFVSIQGEGRLSGAPSLFIRTGRCPLRCVWCDTPYASRHRGGRIFSVPEIMAFVAAAPPVKHVVVTGGEPLVEKDLPELTRKLAEQGKHITLETTGLVYRSLQCHLVSLSPKLANAAAGRAGCNIPALRTWMQRHDYQLKFVVAGAADMPEVLECLAGLRMKDRSRAYLMPQAATRYRLRRIAPAVAELCVKYGFQFSPRLQVDLFGRRRGR
jgi:7-carboxy-7-deazaguanine synthase